MLAASSWRWRYSAFTPAALEEGTRNLAGHLRRHPEVDLADVAYTLQVGRKQFAHRRTLVASSAADLLAVLEKRDPKRAGHQLFDQRGLGVADFVIGAGNAMKNVGERRHVSRLGWRQFGQRPLDLAEAVDLRVRLLGNPQPFQQRHSSSRVDCYLVSLGPI